MQCDGVDAMVVLRDTAGQEAYAAINDASFKNCHCFMLCFAMPQLLLDGKTPNHSLANAENHVRPAPPFGRALNPEPLTTLMAIVRVRSGACSCGRRATCATPRSCWWGRRWTWCRPQRWRHVCKTLLCSSALAGKF